jgi:hypothetical protein
MSYNQVHDSSTLSVEVMKEPWPMTEKNRVPGDIDAAEHHWVRLT